MFAHKIRDRDAPGYSAIVRNPVDLKSIRTAIQQGNKAAIAALSSLPESDANASSVWLPIGEDLVPPRGIINSSQLECELVHMFANAIMYNPDSHRGPGPAFEVSRAHEGDASTADASILGYKVDEDGVVNQARDMYLEVEKLLSEMRSAEKQRGAPPLPAGATGTGTGTTTRQASVVGGGAAGDAEAAAAADEVKDETTSAATHAEGTGTGTGTGTVKRRRITRG